MHAPHRKWSLVLVLVILLVGSVSSGRNPIRNAFFNVYPAAEATRLKSLPSNSSHCGVCHFDFDGAGQRNSFGLAVEVAINSGMYGSNEDAILSLDGLDSDNDGFTNNVEITDISSFTNTPTFPGLKASNVSNTSNVDLADILEYLTPSGSSDTTPPDVTVLSPNGAELFGATSIQTITWTATDASGIASVDIYLSDDSGVEFKPMASGLANSGSYSWFVPNLPSATSQIRVEATDGVGNDGFDDSDADFTVDPLAGGVIPTTLRDFELAGTQPHESGILENPSVSCVTCHGNYDQVVEPWHTWRGSMMAQAARDPLWLATMIIAEQDAPAVGDLCLRCHTPGGWQEGRSVDTTGGMLTATDREGVQCDFCHRMVDPIYEAGVSPPVDLDILADLDPIPPTTANGMFITDPDPVRRGPYADADASHQFLESPFHRSADLCGTCHDVSNPAFVADGSPRKYVPNDFDTPHPDFDLRNMFPVERTFSEWTQSEYASTGVYAPQFAGNLPGGMVSTCQDCHMKDVSGAGSSEPGSPTRTDLPLHDLTGGNHFAIDLVEEYYPGESTTDQLADGRGRALHMLSLAASMQ
ncbi:MAG: Ig-like domain-containing protein, partial [bacterium]